MLALIVVLVGATAGLVSRRWALPFIAIMRAQYLMVAPVAFLAGWSADITVSHVVAVGVLLLGEAAAVAAAGLILSRSEGRAGWGLATGAATNTAAWAYPVAAAVSPSAVAFVVLYDLGTSPVRGTALTWLLRRHAPTTQSTKSLITDYASQFALAVGLILMVSGVAAPTWSGQAITYASLALASLVYLMLGHAWPSMSRDTLVWQGLLLTALHVTLPAGMLTTAWMLGLAVPSGAWVLGMGCTWYAFINVSRLYGYRTDVAATAILTSLTCAVLLLPLTLEIA